MNLLDTIQQHLAPTDIQAISDEIGADPTTTATAIDAALPMMVGSMAHTAQQPGARVLSNRP